MVFFIGHTKEIDGEAYLVPLEGDFKDATTLIPLKWVYEKLAECQARQKILVLDGNRYNAAQGEERPVGGADGGEVRGRAEGAAGRRRGVVGLLGDAGSHEFDGAPLGVFLDSLRLAPDAREGLQGRAGRQHPEARRPHPAGGAPRSRRRQHEPLTGAAQVKQTPFLAGKPPADGAEYDRDEAAGRGAGLPDVQEQATSRRSSDLLAEISLPPVKSSADSGADLDFASLPPFSPDALKKYERRRCPPTPSCARRSTRPRVALWAVSTAHRRRAISQGDVAAYRDEVAQQGHVDHAATATRAPAAARPRTASRRASSTTARTCRASSPCWRTCWTS